MYIAIHKKTKKHISAYQITKSLEWKGREREKFIAPYHEVGNWEELKKKGIKEVKVSFVIRHIRKYRSGKTLVDAHFRIETKGARENLENESEEHKLAKEHIYFKAIENKLILKVKSIGSKKLSELGEIEDIRIEKGVGRKRADVLVKFKENKIYGKGIAFEIQISPQSNQETIKRNYDRASYGYSIVWIWSDDLKEDNNEYELIPYNEALEEYKKQIKEEINQELWDISKRAYEKISEINNEIGKTLNSWNLKREQLKQDIISSMQTLSKIYENIKEDTKDRIKEEILKNIKGFNFSELSEQYFKDNLDIKLNSFLEEKNILIDNKISTLLNSIIQNKSKEESFNKEIEDHLDKLIYNYDSKIKNELIQKSEKILNQLSTEAKLKIQVDLENKFSESIKQFVKESVKEEVNELLKKELLNLKEETISSYHKNKVSLYLKCPICKEDKHIMCFEINSSGKILCRKCLEERDGEKKDCES